MSTYYFNQTTTTPHLFFLKKLKKNYPRHGTLDPRHGTLDPRPSTKRWTRINALIYVMGNNAADIYDSFKLSGEDIQYANVKQKFKDHFKGKVPLVFERTQFVRRFQQDKESVLTIIEDLQKRADLCSFGSLRSMAVLVAK